MPEISGPGQKKIIESNTYVYAATVIEATSLIYYLAAMGVGRIYCSFVNEDGCEKLFSNVSDLNGDVVIELLNNDLHMENSNTLNSEGFVIRILVSNCEKLKDNFIKFSNSLNCNKFMPTIMIINNGWKGFLQTFNNQEDFELALQSFDFCDLQNSTQEKEGSMLSANLLGALTAVECVKLCLKIGTIVDKPLCFDLLSMEFKRFDNKNFKLAIADFIKNNCSESLPHKSNEKLSNIKKLSESKVLIVGAGGLGSPVAYALSSIGIGTIGLVDYDTVEISNLNRQILHSTSRIGMPKVSSGEVFIKNFFPEVKVVTHDKSLTSINAMDIIRDYDVIIDALDNFPARYLLNDACFFSNKPLVDAAAVKFFGLIMTIVPRKGPCYRCLFPARSEQSAGMSCSESGVLGPVPGVMGFIQAAEVAKLLLGRGDTLHNKLLYYDAMDSDFDTINTDSSLNCDLCGTLPTITTLTEYKNPCERS